MNAPFYLGSDHHVTEQQLRKIDRATSSMMSSGLYEFYTSYAEFKRRIMKPWCVGPCPRHTHDSDDDDLQVLTMEQLRRPMMLIFGLWALAAVIFVIEYIISKVNNWRSCRIRKLVPKRDSTFRFRRQFTRFTQSRHEFFRRTIGKFSKNPRK